MRANYFTRLVKITALCFTVLAASAAPSFANEGMSLIPKGEYSPLYKSSVETKPISVEAFWMDVRPVSNLDFLKFVTANPQWRRSKIKPIFADASYLGHWADDTDLGPHAERIAELPVTNVSWFAARAFARWQGKRLPTVSEWEMVGIASETQADGREETGYYNRILEWYGKPNRAIHLWEPDTYRNFHGVYGMHGLVWEWVDDFNTALVTGESRGDTDLERNLFCGSGSVNSSNFRDYAAFMRFGFRSSLSGDYAITNLGFRCAKDAEPTPPTNP